MVPVGFLGRRARGGVVAICYGKRRKKKKKEEKEGKNLL